MEVGPEENGRIIYSNVSPISSNERSGIQVCPSIRIENNTGQEIKLESVTTELLGVESTNVFTYSEGWLIYFGLSSWIPLQYKDESHTGGLYNVTSFDLPSAIKFDLLFDINSTPKSVVRKLYPHRNASANGSYPFWGMISNLNTGEFWTAHTTGNGGHHNGRERFAYDAGITRFDSSSNTWTGLKPNGSSDHNEDFLCYGKNLYAITDGDVFSFRDPAPSHANERDEVVHSLTIKSSYNERTELIIYAHLRPGSIPAHLKVAGARVSLGEKIGEVGTTGTYAPHLHIHVTTEDGRFPLPLLLNNLLIDKRDKVDRWIECGGRGLPWASTAKCRLLLGSSNPVAVSWGHNRLDVFARNRDGKLVHKYWPSNNDWSDWNVHEGVLDLLDS